MAAARAGLRAGVEPVELDEVTPAPAALVVKLALQLAQARVSHRLGEMLVPSHARDVQVLHADDPRLDGLRPSIACRLSHGGSSGAADRTADAGPDGASRPRGRAPCARPTTSGACAPVVSPFPSGAASVGTRRVVPDAASSPPSGDSGRRAYGCHRNRRADPSGRHRSRRPRFQARHLDRPPGRCPPSDRGARACPPAQARMVVRPSSAAAHRTGRTGTTRRPRA